MAVIIFGFWNVPGVRNCINPLKLFTIGWHELCHIIAVRPSLATTLTITHTCHNARAGNPNWWPNPKNYHRPARRRRDNRRRRKPNIRTLCRVYWIHTSWGFVCPRWLGHTRCKNHELRAWGWSGDAFGSC